MITGWDFLIPIVGAVPAVLMGVALYMSRRAQMLREQVYGESLRDQLGRHIAQLDYQATRAVRLGSVLASAVFVGATAILLAAMRVNSEPKEPFDDWEAIVGGIFVCAVENWMCSTPTLTQQVLLARPERQVRKVRQARSG